MQRIIIFMAVLLLAGSCKFAVSLQRVVPSAERSLTKGRPLRLNISRFRKTLNSAVQRWISFISGSKTVCCKMPRY